MDQSIFQASNRCGAHRHNCGQHIHYKTEPALCISNKCFSFALFVFNGMKCSKYPRFCKEGVIHWEVFIGILLFQDNARLWLWKSKGSAAVNFALVQHQHLVEIYFVFKIGASL